MRYWQRGDVVQTVVPYDDYPVTVVRHGSRWRPVNVERGARKARFTDEEIQRWVDEGAAIIKALTN